MAIKEIAVNTSTLTNDIDALQTVLVSARTQLDDMFNQVAELDTMWDGPANEEFNRQFGNDYENAKNLCETIESIIGCMKFARDQYITCENEVNGIVSAITI